MDILLTYGAHAKPAIPELKKVADYFQNDERGFPRNLSLLKAKIIRETIKKIEASNDSPKLVHLK